MDALQDLVRVAKAGPQAGSSLDDRLGMFPTVVEPFHQHFIGFFIGIMPVPVHGKGKSLHVLIQGLSHLSHAKYPNTIELNLYWLIFVSIPIID